MSSQTALAIAPRLPLPLPGDRLELGTSGLRVSPYCLGAVDDPEAIPAAYEAGINFFFVTADMHWPLYERARVGLARLLERYPEARDEIVVAGVAYVTQPEFCAMPFEELIDAVDGLQHLDVLIAGGSYEMNLAQRMEVFAEHRRTGFVGSRAIGATFHARQAATEWLNSDELDMGFIRYNPLHQGALDDLFPDLNPERRSLIYGFKSMTGYLPENMYGFPPGEYWMPKPPDYYRFALSSSPLHGILCSPGNPAEIEELVRAAESGALDDEECEHMLVLAHMHNGGLVAL